MVFGRRCIPEGGVALEAPRRPRYINVFVNRTTKVPTHALSIPRQHIVTLDPVTEDHGELLGSIQIAAARLSREEGLEGDGWRLVTRPILLPESS